MKDRFFEDIPIGEEFVTPIRRIVEQDFAFFAAISGDYKTFITDEVLANPGAHETEIGHELLGVVVASGLFSQSQFFRVTGNNIVTIIDLKWKFLKPLRIGDSIYVKLRVMSKKATSHSERGLLILRRTLINQLGEMVQDGETTLIIKRRRDNMSKT